MAMRRASYALDALGTEYVQRHPSSLLLSAIINLREGKDRAAFDALLRYRRYDPANTTASRLLAISHLRQGNAKDAVRVLKPFMQSLAQDAQANAVIGRAKLLQKDLAQAQRYLKAATMLAPTDSDYRTTIGSILACVFPSATVVIRLKAHDSVMTNHERLMRTKPFVRAKVARLS